VIDVGEELKQGDIGAKVMLEAPNATNEIGNSVVANPKVKHCVRAILIQDGGNPVPE
jgi:hypothetical protein